MENFLTDILKTEQKLGFDKVRESVCAKCSMAYSKERAGSEGFSTSVAEISRRL